MQIKKRKFFFKFWEELLRENQIIFSKIKIREQRIVDKEIFIKILIIVLVNNKYTIIY